MEQHSWLEEFKRVGALWIHDGNPKRPHALLTSGKHSNGFFNASKVIARPDLLGAIVLELADRCQLKSLSIDWVVGSALGAVTIAHAFAYHLRRNMAFTEKADDGTKKMVLARFDIEAADHVLIVEDVMTTGGTTLETIAAIEATGAKVLEPIVVIANRSGTHELNGRRLASLIELSIDAWAPEECPLCTRGSVALRPKKNWDKLTAEF